MMPKIVAGMVSPFALDRCKAVAWSVSRIFLSVAILSVLGVSLAFPDETPRHFTHLADTFVHGSFSVNNLPPNYADKVLVDGNIYLPLAPMPGILLMPFVGIFGLAFDEYWLAIFLTAVNFLYIGHLLRRLQIPREQHGLLLALFFCGTIYFSALVVGRSWFLAHILATTLLLFAILEFLTRRRAWLIGVWLGLAFLTRSPTILSIPFFIWMCKPADVARSDPRWLLALGIRMSLGLAAPLLFYAYYNYARFGNSLETGYAYAIVGSPVLADALKYGLFSPAHLPKNLYALLLALPQAYPSFSAPVLGFPYIYPSPWGMGLFFTTPAFIYAFAANWRERVVRAAWLAIGLVLVPLVLYYGVGWIQFGYRYALDFYPFLFMLVALGLSRHLDWKARALIILSIVINVWGAWWQLIGFRMLPVELLK